MKQTQSSIRAQLAVWAYAYEIMDDPFVPDIVFDKKCLEVDISISTGHEILDKFFVDEFTPSTGMWIYKHPEVNKAAWVYQRIRNKAAKYIPPYKNDSPPVPKHISDIGFKTQEEMKWYLASLGFTVIPHLITKNGQTYHTEFDKECGYILNEHTKEQRTIFYKDMFPL